MPKKNMTPGMDDTQAQKDRGGWSTTVENLTGGEKKPLGEDSGMEVGTPYDNDPMGEDRSKTTYTND